ncbi:hypothetical protein [Desulfolucanica intricata]|uniref:hypothetical protein n=1 Tax=Desulfolucanica intricata TaxID=1285191 RepID=UPI000831AC4B|nr:hypothetical protein [Desulfolucanica intricata]
MKLIKAWYHNSLREGTLDIRYLLLWFEDEPGLLFFVVIFVYLLHGLFNIDAIMVLPLFWIVPVPVSLSQTYIIIRSPVNRAKSVQKVEFLL